MADPESSPREGADPVFIIAFDGGGYRGLFGARLLEHIEKHCGLRWPGKFRLFAGASTGSILAAGLASGMSASSLVRTYERLGPRIFPARRRLARPFRGLLRSSHSARTLREELGRLLVRPTQARLVIAATNIEDGAPHLFRFPCGQSPPPDLADAVLASCSGPTWFDPATVGANRFADGGLWAQNPSLVAFLEARNVWPRADLCLLSVGAGESRHYYPQKRSRAWWGLGTGWGGDRLVELNTNVQALGTARIVDGLIRPRDRLLRLSFRSPDVLRFDDASTRQELEDYAGQVFHNRRKEICSFLG